MWWPCLASACIPRVGSIARHSETPRPRMPTFSAPRHPKCDAPRLLKCDAPRHPKCDAPRLLKCDAPRHPKRDAPRHLKCDAPRHLKCDAPRHLKCDAPRRPPSTSCYPPAWCRAGTGWMPPKSGTGMRARLCVFPWPAMAQKRGRRSCSAAISFPASVRKRSSELVSGNKQKASETGTSSVVPLRQDSRSRVSRLRPADGRREGYDSALATQLRAIILFFPSFVGAAVWKAPQNRPENPPNLDHCSPPALATPLRLT